MKYRISLRTVSSGNPRSCSNSSSDPDFAAGLGTGLSSCPVLAVTTFTDDADALEIANDTLYGLGAGVWTRDGARAYKMGRGIKAGRVWTNCYHEYPAGAAFGGYKISGVGRENHRMMLDHYSQTKNLLVSYSSKPLGLF